MCFDRGTQKKKLDNFLIFFQVLFVVFGGLPETDRGFFSVLYPLQERLTHGCGFHAVGLSGGRELHHSHDRISIS